MERPKRNFDRAAVPNKEDYISVSVPPEIAQHLDLESGDTIRFQEEEGEYGPYASMWNPDQQKENQSETE